MKLEKKNLVRFFALALPLLSAIVVATLPFQAANAQITGAQHQALKSMVATGFTNNYPLKVGSQNFSIPYSISLGQVITMIADKARTSLDIYLRGVYVYSPTPHQTEPGVFMIQIPRDLLDSKNSSGADIPFMVGGHSLIRQQLQSNNTGRVLGIYFPSEGAGFLQIFGTQIAH